MRKDLEERVEQAGNNFLHGYACSQSVFSAFADLYGIKPEEARRLALGFGAGVGRLRMMCGGVSALTLLAGLETEHSESNDLATRKECYELVQRFVKEFQKRAGSIMCGTLLGPAITRDTSTAPSERTPEYYKSRPCYGLVRTAATIFAEYLEEKDATTSRKA